MTRFAARHGIHAEGYDISPEMIAIAREEAAREGLDVVFEAGDYEQLDLGRRFDACLIYDALHHSERPELVLAAAQRALKPGGRILLAEPNWKQRFQGRAASEQVRDDRARLQPATPEAAAARGGLHRGPPLPQQPQAAVLELARRHGRASRRAAHLPAARALLDADLAQGSSDLARASSPVVSELSGSSSTARSSAGIARPKSCWPSSKLPSSNHARQFSGCSSTASM